MNDNRAFFKLLEELAIPSQTVEHEAVLTAGGLARRDLSQWEFPVKNILVEDKGKQLYLITMHLLTPPLDLKEAFQAHRRERAASHSPPRKRWPQRLRVLPGSVTPFATFNDRARKVRVVLDERLKKGAHDQRPSACQYGNHHHSNRRSVQALRSFRTPSALVRPSHQGCASGAPVKRRPRPTGW